VPAGDKVGIATHNKAVKPAGGPTTEYVTHRQCDTRPTITFPATAVWLVLISHSTEGRKLSWRECQLHETMAYPRTATEISINQLDVD